MVLLEQPTAQGMSAGLGSRRFVTEDHGSVNGGATPNF
jgi:hypothetical protein